MNQKDFIAVELAAIAEGYRIGNEVGEYGWWRTDGGEWVFARRNEDGTSTPWWPEGFKPS